MLLTEVTEVGLKVLTERTFLREHEPKYVLGRWMSVPFFLLLVHSGLGLGHEPNWGDQKHVNRSPLPVFLL